MVTARVFIIGIGALLILVGGVGLVLHQLRVFQTCTSSTGVYGLQQTCSQSPALLVVAIAVMAVGLVVVIGGVVVKGADE